MRVLELESISFTLKFITVSCRRVVLPVLLFAALIWFIW